MDISKNILEETAKKGAGKAAEDFSKLAGSTAEVKVSAVRTVPLEEVMNDIKSPERFSVTVYAQVLTGIKGVAVLVLPRESALSTVDLLNREVVGTTGVLKDMDISAVKETLNILSNSFVGELAKHVKSKIEVGVPNIISAERFNVILGRVLENDGGSEKAVIFETELTITQHEIDMSLYLIFNDEVVELIEDTNR